MPSCVDGTTLDEYLVRRLAKAWLILTATVDVGTAQADHVPLAGHSRVTDVLALPPRVLV